MVLRALSDELERSRELRVVSLERPTTSSTAFTTRTASPSAATLGALNSIQKGRARVPASRCGWATTTSTTATTSTPTAAFGTRYDLGACPLDDHYTALRQYFWLATDAAYKSAVEVIARKRAALKNVTVTDQLPDFSKAEPATMLVQAPRRNRGRGGLEVAGA